MDDCIFCTIVSGDISAHKIYEDEHFMAFLDIHPQTPGHAQVIPKRHYRWVWDVPNAGDYFEVVRKIAVAQRSVFGTDWILSKIVGDEVPHAHIWVFPSNEAHGDVHALEENAEKLRAALR
ncbi:HIT domain-containing protein [Patescibacteria group bacterium]|nr:HIT domain-containing protein [Patescibacteria group bacterium]